MKATHQTFRTGCILTLLLLLGGCSELSPIGGSNAIILDQQEITPEGGGLSIAGARVTFPPDAVREPVTISLRRRQSPDALPATLGEALSQNISISPAETPLFEPAVVELDVDALEDFAVLAQPGDRCDWSLLSPGLLSGDLTRIGQTLIFSVNFLGTFVAARPLEETEEDLCFEDEACGFATNLCFGVGDEQECFEEFPNICRTDGSCASWDSCACFQEGTCFSDSWSSYLCRIPPEAASDACSGFIGEVLQRTKDDEMSEEE